MGDESQYQQSNSGHGACEITRGGKRSEGVETVVQIVSKYPGIDSFSGAYVLAGGQVEQRNGQYHLVGKTNQLTAQELAKVIKYQARVVDAAKRGEITETARTFHRPVKSTGYKVVGGGVFPDPNLPKRVDKPTLRKVSGNTPPQPGQYGKLGGEPVKTDVRVLPKTESVKHDDERGEVVGMPADLKALME